MTSQAVAGRSDGSIVLAGSTTGAWDEAGEKVGIRDFAAVALDEDGQELWRWQVCGREDLGLGCHEVLSPEASGSARRSGGGRSLGSSGIPVLTCAMQAFPETSTEQPAW